MSIHCTVPAKLILSGEHAVLYGAPALSLAIDLPTECHLRFAPSNQSSIEIHLLNYQLHQAWSFNQAWQQAETITARFNTFQQQQLTIRDVCQTPFDLVLQCLWHFQQYSALAIGAWRIDVQSTAWAGRGLGSSAAVIISVLSTLFNHHKLDDLNAVHDLLDMAKKIESYQHGQSSGLDTSTILHGGLLRFQRDKPVQHIAHQSHQAWLIDTGEPQSTTGECVAAVKQFHAQDLTLWQAFSKCTEDVHQAWLQQNTADLQRAVQTNHQLLMHIGVVPNKVATLITELQQQGFAAKVCGAGSVSGDAAGVVMALGTSDPTVLCESRGYRCKPLNIDHQGVRCVEGI